jgi:DNA-binding MarR family transcriptional regulator
MTRKASITTFRIDGDEYVPALLSNLNNRLSSGASDLYLQRFGIGINEWRILSVLSNTPHSNATHIGETVSMHKGVVSRGVRELQDKGLLTIQRRSGNRTMALTRQGQAMHDEVATIALQREVLLLDGISIADRKKLVQLLRRLRDNLSKVNAWEPPAKAPALLLRSIKG